MCGTDSSRLQLDLDALLEWSNVWLLGFNVNKCAVMHYGYQNQREEYTIGGEILRKTDNERDLGVIMYCDAKFELFCSCSCQAVKLYMGSKPRCDPDLGE